LEAKALKLGSSWRTLGRLPYSASPEAIIASIVAGTSDARIDLVTQRGTPDNEAEAVLMLTVKARLQRVGREIKMLVENTDDQSEADPALLRIVARAHDIQGRLMQKSGRTLHAIASQEHVTPGYVSRLLRLSSLAPDITTAIVNGKNPPQLTAKKLDATSA
jgi:site-specific DNA recombinase